MGTLKTPTRDHLSTPLGKPNAIRCGYERLPMQTLEEFTLAQLLSPTLCEDGGLKTFSGGGLARKA